MAKNKRKLVQEEAQKSSSRGKLDVSAEFDYASAKRSHRVSTVYWSIVSATASVFIVIGIQFVKRPENKPTYVSPPTTLNVNTSQTDVERYKSEISTLQEEIRKLWEQKSTLLSREDALKNELCQTWRVPLVMVWQKLKNSNFMFTREGNPNKKRSYSSIILDMCIVELLNAIRFDTKGIDANTQSIRPTVLESLWVVFPAACGDMKRNLPQKDTPSACGGVVYFQGKYGIKVDGVIGPQTWNVIVAKLDSECPEDLSMYRLKEK